MNWQCAICGYNDQGTGDSAHVCRATPPSPSTASEAGELPATWESRTKFRDGGYCDTSDAMKAMQDEIKEWRTRAALAANIAQPTTQPLCDSALRAEPAGQRDACTCVYATAANTPSVRKGYEMGGYLKQECDVCAKEDARSRAEGGNTQPSGSAEVDVEAEREWIGQMWDEANQEDIDAYGPPVYEIFAQKILARRTQAEGAKDAEVEAARYRYIEERATTHGGGHGFTITCFVPVDHEDMGCGIDAAISATQKGE